MFSTLRSGKVGGKDLFDASVYKDDRLTSMFHDMVRNLHEKTSDATPTDFHHLLASLAEEGRLLRLYSQNVDCIDTRLEPLKTSVPLAPKGPWPKTVQLHGGLEKMNCSRCNFVGQFEPEKFNGATPPECGECTEMETVREIAGKRCLGVGRLRPRIVLYNEFNPEADVIGQITNADLKARPDAVIVVGTSLKVPGVRRIVREMCGVVQDYRGGMTIWINECDPPVGREFDGAFDLIVKGDCQKVAQLASMPRYDGSEPSTPPPSQQPQTTCTVEVQVLRPLQQLLSPSISPQPTKEAKPAGRKRTAAAVDAAENPAKKARKTPAPKAKTKAPAKAAATKRNATVMGAFKTVKKAVTSVVAKAKPKRAYVRKVPVKTPEPAISDTITVFTPPSSETFSPPSPTMSSPLSSPPASISSARSSRIPIGSLLN